MQPSIPPRLSTVCGLLGPEATDALVITCSDRRFRRPVEAFLSTGLGLHNYDIIAVPGGVYALVSSDSDEDGPGMTMMRFLVGHHTPKRAVLIAHEACARYATTYASEIGSLEDRQVEDLRSAGARISEAFSTIEVSAYFGRVENFSNVSFHRVY